MPEGQNILILSRQGQNFKMITGAKHEGYISVWARVRSTRVPNIIHHEGRGCNAYKDKRDRSFKILRYFLKPFLKGKILRSSERGVNSILTTILQF